MKDRERRQRVLDDGKYRIYTQMRKQAFLNGEPEKMFENVFDDETGELITSQLNPDYFHLDEEDLKECERIRNCKTHQRQKIEDHINFLFDKTKYDLFFITFNFNDDAMELNADTRKQKIRRLLNKVSEDYILNIDFGKIRGREHYHSIVALEKGAYTLYKNEFEHFKIKELDSYDYGNYDIEGIRTGDEDKKRLARYITKLTLHSVKVEQRYVSVKKGSAYQVQKNLIKSLKKDAKIYRLFKPDYSDLLNANSY